MLALFATFIFVLNLVVALPAGKLYTYEYPLCPNGWIRYLDSCYYVELARFPFDTAQIRCMERQATLFIPDSVAEWNDVMVHTPLNFWSWVGLKKSEAERPAQWQGGAGMDMDKINWLAPPIMPQSNGWNPAAQCLAHFNSEHNRYAYFYSCNMEYHSICERNATLREIKKDSLF